MKKFLALVLCLTLVLTCFTALFGCGPGFRTYTHGDWVIMHSAEGECKIFDLSEEGKQKEVLIFPTEVAGRKVTGTYYESAGWYSDGYQISSEKLKRLYFTEYVELENGAIYSMSYYKAFALFSIVGENSFNRSSTRGYNGVMWCLYKDNAMEIREKFYKNADFFPANVVYYNCSDKHSNEIYWIDDYDGETIKYLPANPSREGYEFTGWYKEPECINKWDFETDIVPNKSFDENLYYIYNETSLYAGWRKL